MLPLELAGVDNAADAALQAIFTVGLEPRKGHYPHQLSGGEKQRVAIARAFVVQPTVLFADEPTGNLDSHTGEKILESFRNLHKEGRTIMLVTHDPEIAAMTPKRIEIRDGKIAADVDAKLSGRESRFQFQSDPAAS